MTVRWLISAAILDSIYLLYHTPGMTDHMTDHSSGLDDHSVTDQQSQALDQRASVIKTHRRHPASSRVSAGSKGQQQR